MQELDARGAPGFETIALASLSDAGRVRAENQDSVALIENTSGERLLVVADGMGGHRGGETASKLCLKTLERVFREPHGTPEQRLIRGFELANEEVYSHALANPELRGMGTTAVVALLAPGGRAWVAWVGDSRMYRMRGGVLEQLTQDHSLMAEWITIGVITAEAARTHPRRHELTRALGQTPDVVVDLLPIELRPGDRLLLCSDGLHGCVADNVLARALKHGVPDVAACALVDAANANGGPDNVSVVVVALPEASEPAPFGIVDPAAVTAPWSEPEPEPEAAGTESSIAAQTEAVAAPEPGPELGFDPPLGPMPEPVREATREPERAAEPGADTEPDLVFVTTSSTEPEPVSEPAAEPEPEPEPELAFASPPPTELVPEPAPVPAFALAPDLDRELAECAPEIAAELGALGPSETFAEPDAPAAVASDAEISFADLGAELVADPQPSASSPELEPAPVSAPAFARDSHPTPSVPIQIPLMTPVRARRGLDATSLVVGVTTTLLVVGLGLSVWSYTTSRSSSPSPAPPHPQASVARSTPAPAPGPRPAQKPIEKPPVAPAAQPLPAPASRPVVAQLPPAPAPAPAPAPTPAALPAQQAAQARVLPVAPSVPAAPDPSPDPSAASVAKFELTPEVERFLTAWLAALASDDRARLAALGFPDEPSAFAGTPGSREGFRLVAADIDEERSQGGRVYLRLIVSYAFRDASGRFRTQDEQRLILHDVGGRLRFEGRWQQ